MPKRLLIINCPREANGRFCIYRIWFGDSFYLGSSTNLKNRIDHHISKIHGCFAGKRIGNNSHTAIMRHLAINPEIIYGFIKILEFIDTEYELVQAEKTWMNKLFYKDNCLNYSNNTSRKVDGVIVRPNNAEEI